MRDEAYFCKLTALLFQYYLLEPTKENFEKMFSYFSDQLVMIGTGKHEFFTNTDQIIANMIDNQIEAEAIQFQVLDEWYECRKMTQEVYLVYGGIWVRQQQQEQQEEQQAVIEMDTRFSVLYRQRGDTCEVLHLHHSMPYIEQQKGEHYPQALVEKAKDAMQLARIFQKKAEMDLLTEIYNHVSFQSYATQRMQTCVNGNLYLFDLDFFKRTNDTHGHLTGDEVLKLFSGVLKESFCENAVIGRVGGDEFAVFEVDPMDKAGTIEKIARMQKTFALGIRNKLGQESSGFSVGIVAMTPEKPTYSELFANADRALYRAKQHGRNTFEWHTK